MPEETDTRREELLHWLRFGAGIAVDELTTASADASFRRYFRVHSAGQRYIAMDAPPELEDSEPFVRIAAWLAEIGLNSPRVLAQDLKCGYLLLTDLGDRQFLHTLNSAPQRAGDLYRDAMSALDTLQDKGVSYQQRLPVFNSSLLGDEMALFRDWLCATHLQLSFTADDEDRWNDTCHFLIESALAQPRVFVHRDYHSRNLMHCEQGNPGMLDFQDAVNGPLTYDLVSLLKDCYVRRPAAEVEQHAVAFYGLVRERLPTAFDEVAFMRAFELMGVQRHLKAAGIFARLNHRDQKAAYLADIPLTLSYITEVAGRYAELGFLHELVRDRCLPALQVAA